MALPHLIKIVYNSGTDEVIRRGKKIHSFGYVELVEHDDLINSVTFRVKDDSYSTFYKVHVQKYDDPKTLLIRCTCPYNLGDICATKLQRSSSYRTSSTKICLQRILLRFITRDIR